MKLIDEKGRLFGKINLIDLLVVLLIVRGSGGSRLETRRQKGRGCCDWSGQEGRLYRRI